MSNVCAVQIQIYKCQSHMQKMSNMPNACDGCFILAKKDVGHLQRMFTHTSLHCRTYTESSTQIHVWRTDKTEKYWGARARCTYLHAHVHTNTELQVLGQDALPTKSIESYENNSTPSSYNYSDRGKGGGK